MTPCRLDARRYGFPRKTGWIVVAVTVLLQCAFISRFEKKGRLRFCPGHPLYEMKEELFKKYQHSFPNIRMFLECWTNRHLNGCVYPSFIEETISTWPVPPGSRYVAPLNLSEHDLENSEPYSKPQSLSGISESQGEGSESGNQGGVGLSVLNSKYADKMMPAPAQILMQYGEKTKVPIGIQYYEEERDGVKGVLCRVSAGDISESHFATNKYFRISKVKSIGRRVASVKLLNRLELDIDFVDPKRWIDFPNSEIKPAFKNPLPYSKPIPNKSRGEDKSGSWSAEDVNDVDMKSRAQAHEAFRDFGGLEAGRQGQKGLKESETVDSVRLEVQRCAIDLQWRLHGISQDLQNRVSS
ncbi:hypothetical protein AAMO2058_000883300 [Amorphochlora amoebiformis]